MMSIRRVVAIVLVLVILGILLPIGLVYIGDFEWTQVTLANGTTTTVKETVDPTVITLVSVLLPIMVVIGIIMYFIPRTKT